MNISNSIVSTLYYSALSTLKTANEQPQLALSLIRDSLGGMETVATAQTPVTKVTSSLTAELQSGRFIDISV